MRPRTGFSRVLCAASALALVASLTPCMACVTLTEDEQKLVYGGCTVKACVYQGGCMWPYYFDAPAGSACIRGSGPDNYPTWGCHGAAKVAKCTTWPTGQECGHEIMGQLDENHQCVGKLYEVTGFAIHCYYCK